MQVIPFLPEEPFLGLRLRHAVEAAWCEELAADLSRRGFTATGAQYPRGYRDNDRLVLDDAALAARLYTALRAGLPETLEREGSRWQLVGLNSRLRACRYREGQSFCIHRDGPYQPDGDTRSWLTVQLYLDDARRMRGGRTRFYADAEGRTLTAAIEPARGDVIVFDHRAWHDGEAVTEGEKRVLRSDAIYRRIDGAARPGSLSQPPSPQGKAFVGQHRGYAWRVLARRDGSIASSGRDGTVRIWRDGESIAHPIANSSVTALIEDGDGVLWAGTRDGSIFQIGRKDPVLSGEGAILALAATPSGRILAATSHGEILLLTADGVTRRQRTHQGWAWDLAPTDTTFASVGDDGELVFADGRRVSLGQSLRAVAALSPHVWLAGTRDGLVYKITGSRRDLIRAHTAAITSLAVSPDGAHWASASEDGDVKLWHATSYGAVLLWEAPRRADFVTGVAFASAREIVTAGYDGSIHRISPPAIATACSAAG